MNLRFENTLIMAIQAERDGKEGRAAQLLDQAKASLNLPENDTSRPAQDRADWAAARKVG